MGYESMEIEHRPIDTEEKPLSFPAWMRGFLLLATFYNLAWGLFILNFPDAFYKFLTTSAQPAPTLITYQGVGIIIFAFLYLAAAIYPTRLWFLVLAGFISKLFGAIGVFILVMDMQVTKKFIFHLVMNDLVWLIPLGIITYTAYNHRIIGKAS